MWYTKEELEALMSGHHPSPMSSARTRLPILLAIMVVSALTSAESCLDDPPAVPCQANCDIEDECDFRTLAACEAASCDPVTGAALHRGLDACLGAAPNCLEAAACACSDGCDKATECGADADPGCESDCDTLVDQLPKDTYRENVCRIESACEDQAVCSSVSG